MDDKLPLEQHLYVKSNRMISAKFNSSLAENKLMAIALTRVEHSPIQLGSELVANFSASELKHLISDEKNIYRDLKKLAKTVTGHTMFLEDSKGNLRAFSLCSTAEYKGGILSIHFNQVLVEYLLKLEKNFTTLDLSIITNFTRSSTFRIYELLRKELCRSNLSVNYRRADIEYNLAEFRFMIGIADIDHEVVQRYMKGQSSNNGIDWEEIYLLLVKSGKTGYKYHSTDKLKENCINIAQKELQLKSDIRFEYELLHEGREYKRIVFHIFPNTPQNTEEISNSQRFIEQLE